MVSKKTLEIQKEIPRTITILIPARSKDHSKRAEFKFKQRRKKNTKGAFGG